MKRYTEYHAGVAVIKNKALLPKAMAKLARFENSQEQVESFTTEMMEHICDNLCRHPREASDQETLEDICAECRMGEFTGRIMNLN